jgi:hypothetical protein
MLTCTRKCRGRARFPFSAQASTTPNTNGHTCWLAGVHASDFFCFTETLELPEGQLYTCPAHRLPCSRRPHSSYSTRHNFLRPQPHELSAGSRPSIARRPPTRRPDPHSCRQASPVRLGLSPAKQRLDATTQPSPAPRWP